MSNKRPVNLDIGTIKLPVTSYVSILHRISGVILFFSVAIMLYVLEASLASERGFSSVKNFFSNTLFQIILWGCLIALAYHVIAGLRHIVMDFGIGEDNFQAGRRSAWLVVIIAVICISLITGWIFVW